MGDSIVVVAGTFRDDYERHFDEYRTRLEATIKKHSGVVICSQVAERHIGGSRRPRLIVAIDFPNQYLAEKAFFEPEYLALIPLRNKIFVDFTMYLTR